MYGGRMLVGAALFVALAVAGKAVLGEEQDRNRDQARGAGDYTLVIRHCEVHKTNDKGEAWDVNEGKPDLMVIVRTVHDANNKNANDRDRREFKTKARDDTFSADFNEMINFGVREGQMLEFEVVDVDVAVNDRIGLTRQKIEGTAFREGKHRFENFGRVMFLQVELRKGAADAANTKNKD